MHFTVYSWHRLWFVVFILVIAAELVAIFLHGGGTLSEWTWSKINQSYVRALLGAVLVWLIYHFLWSGPRRGLTWVDGAFALLGVAVGIASYFYRAR